MKISTKGRYALRLMIDLAQNGQGEFIALKDISARQGISIKYLEQIVSTLCKAGFLQSVRGSAGGYRLVKSPEEYVVGDILRITEGNLAPIACLETEKNTCERYRKCETVKFWEGLYHVVDNYVNSYTLSDFTKNKKEE